RRGLPRFDGKISGSGKLKAICSEIRSRARWYWRAPAWWPSPRFFGGAVPPAMILSSTCFRGWKSSANGSMASPIHAGQRWRTGDMARLASYFIRPSLGPWAPRSVRSCPGKWCRARIAGSCSRLPERPCTGWRGSGSRLRTRCLPLCLLRLFLPESEPGFRPTLWLSFTLAAAWLTNAPAAVMIHYSAAGLTLILAAIQAAIGAEQDAAGLRSWSPQSWRHPVRTLVRTALAMLLGAGLASFYLLPAIYEQKWIDVSQVLSPGVRPQDNFLFRTIADPDHNRFNLLVSTVALAEIGALMFAIWFSRKKHVGTAAPGCPVARNATAVSADRACWMLLTAWGVSSAVLMLSVSNSLWQHLPKLRFMQIPFRWLLCMNVALAMLLPMAAKRWTTRLLASAVLLAAVILAGYRFQAPWWDMSADIREMSDAVADGTGYEGTDEYVPAGADPYELNKNLPRISDHTGVPVPSEMLAWEPTEKHFTVHAAAPQNLTVRLFSYPAWEV